MDAEAIVGSNGGGRALLSIIVGCPDETIVGCPDETIVRCPETIVGCPQAIIGCPAITEGWVATIIGPLWEQCCCCPISFG